MKFNRQRFYNVYRSEFGSISRTTTVNNINTMLDSFEKYSALFNQYVPSEQMAYVAATVHHETAGTYGAFKEVRQVRTDTARRKEVRRLQDRYWNTGYYGRGPVQLTWEFNYKWAQELTGRPLLNDPDLLLTDLLLGYEVTIYGMTKGKFTGQPMDRFINARQIDYVGARRVVNGTDRADMIAGYAKKFYNVLKASIEG